MVVGFGDEDEQCLDVAITVASGIAGTGFDAGAQFQAGAGLGGVPGCLVSGVPGHVDHLGLVDEDVTTGRGDRLRIAVRTDLSLVS